MPESLFVRRPFRKSRLIAAVVGSFLLHSSLVGLAALRPLFKTTNIEIKDTDLDTGPVLGEQVQELVLPKDEPIPTPEPDQPTPPPDTPPDDTPPPTEDPDMDIATPKPDTPKPNPKPFKPAGTPFPANAKRGDHPQMGVVGGVPHAEKTTGTPGAAHLGVKAHTPQPPYPYQARAAHITGSGSVSVTFDGSGHASSVSVSQSVGSAILDSNTVQFAKANWTGTPNTHVTVPITYRLN